MTKADQEKAAFFAEAASITDPASLSPGQRLLLQEAAERLFGSPPKPDIERLLHYSRQWLFPLLRGQLVKPDIQPTWRVVNGVLIVGPTITKPGLAFLADLLRLIYLSPFPFKPCPVCGRVFVSQSKKKRYCSANCSYRGIEEARKEQRRPQAKERMRQLRERQKQAAAATQKAIARRHRGEPPAGSEEEAQLYTALSTRPPETDTQRRARQAAEQQRLHGQYQQRKSQK